MKWILIITLIVIIMIIASSVSRQYKEKFEFYTNLKIFLEKYKINVSFQQTKLNDILLVDRSNKSYEIFILAFKEFLKTGELSMDNLKILDVDETIELERIIRSLGLYDVKHELTQIDGFILTISGRLEKAERDKNKLCPMILKLSLLFAIGVSILLI